MAFSGDYDQARVDLGKICDDMLKYLYEHRLSLTHGQKEETREFGSSLETIAENLREPDYLETLTSQEYQSIVGGLKNAKVFNKPADDFISAEATNAMPPHNQVINSRQSREYDEEPLKAVDASLYWNRLCC